MRERTGVVLTQLILSSSTRLLTIALGRTFRGCSREVGIVQWTVDLTEVVLVERLLKVCIRHRIAFHQRPINKYRRDPSTLVVLRLFVLLREAERVRLYAILVIEDFHMVPATGWDTANAVAGRTGTLAGFF